MPLDAEAMNASLKNDYGSTKGPNAPASHQVYLFNGHPALGGTQLTTGYTAPTVTNNGTSWPAPSFGRLTGAVVAFNFTATLSLPATHWALLGADGFWWDGGEVPLGPWTGGAGVTESFQPVIAYTNGETA